MAGADDTVAPLVRATLRVCRPARIVAQWESKGTHSHGTKTPLYWSGRKNPFDHQRPEKNGSQIAPVAMSFRAPAVVLWTFRESSLYRHVRRELMRNALLDFTP